VYEKYDHSRAAAGCTIVPVQLYPYYYRYRTGTGAVLLRYVPVVVPQHYTVSYQYYYRYVVLSGHSTTTYWAAKSQQQQPVQQQQQQPTKQQQHQAALQRATSPPGRAPLCPLPYCTWLCSRLTTCCMLRSLARRIDSYLAAASNAQIIGELTHRPSTRAKTRRGPRAGRSPPEKRPTTASAATFTGAAHYSSAQPAPPRAIAYTGQPPKAVTSATMQTSQHLPEYSNVCLLQKHGPVNPATEAGYYKKWQVLEKYCAARGFDPLTCTAELAMMFCGFIMNRRWRGKLIQSVAAYFSAFNFIYRTKGLGSPWSGRDMAALQTAFKQAQAARAAAAGQNVGALRIAVPFTLIQFMIERAEATNDATQQAWYSVFITMLLFLFRADTIGGIICPEDCQILPSGELRFLVRKLKRDRVVKYRPFYISIPPPQAGTTRASMWNILRQGLPHVPALVASWKGCASREISKAMRELLLPDGGADLIPPGSYLSSHSWRKSGASALAKVGCSMFTIKTWGMWKSTSSAERYVELRYFDAHPQIQIVFDWLCRSDSFSIKFAEVPREALNDADTEDIHMSASDDPALTADPATLGDGDEGTW
jgi:hypothetical protein